MSARQAIALVALRELRERLRSRAFIASTVLLLLFVGASTAFAQALAPEKTFRVGVTAPAPGLEAALDRAAKPFDAEVELRTLPSRAAARAELEDDRLDAVLLLGDDRLVFRAEVDPELGAAADTAVREVRRRLPPEPELTAAVLHPEDAEASGAAVAVALLGSMLMIISLSVYGQWVLVGVVEEKANRVVEVILATVRPRHLLAGKVIGIGSLALAQIALVAGLAAALLAAGMFDAPAELGRDVALIVPWFALGFALYAVAFAAAGALGSRQQDATTAGQPVTLTLVAAYLVGYAALTADPSGTLARVLTILPPSAPMVLPARSALAGVPLWEHVLALGLTLASIWALVRFAGRVYVHGLLRGAGRVTPGAVWRLARRA